MSLPTTVPTGAARHRRTPIAVALAALAFALAALGAGAGAARGAGDVEPPTRSEPAGTFGARAWVHHHGIFSGSTSTGAFRVPYRITGPAHLDSRRRDVLVEPPHFAVGPGVLELWLGPDLVLGRGVAHAAVGYSTTSFGPGADRRILDPSVPGVFIDGGFPDLGGRTDDEIVVEFARALRADTDAAAMLGRVGDRHLAGVSDATDPVLRLVESGRADGLFALAMALTTEGHDPQTALAAGSFGGKLIVVNSEADASAPYVDRGGLEDRYRFHAVAGSPHVPDPLIPFFSNATTPVGFAEAARAHFVHGLRWVRGGDAPSPSTHLRSSDGVTLDRDANGNAIAVDTAGDPVPRLPAVELGEARFVAGFLGSAEAPRSIAELGFASHRHYLAAFTRALAAHQRAGQILPHDAALLRRRASLCPPLTFTQTYLARYDAFVAVGACPD